MKEYTVIVKDSTRISKPGARGKDVPFLFFTKKDMNDFIKRCKKMKLEYKIQGL